MLYYRNGHRNQCGHLTNINRGKVKLGVRKQVRVGQLKKKVRFRHSLGTWEDWQEHCILGTQDAHEDVARKDADARPVKMELKKAVMRTVWAYKERESSTAGGVKNTRGREGMAFGAKDWRLLAHYRCHTLVLGT